MRSGGVLPSHVANRNVKVRCNSHAGLRANGNCPPGVIAAWQPEINAIPGSLTTGLRNSLTRSRQSQFYTSGAPASAPAQLSHPEKDALIAITPMRSAWNGWRC